MALLTECNQAELHSSDGLQQDCWRNLRTSLGQRVSALYEEESAEGHPTQVCAKPVARLRMLHAYLRGHLMQCVPQVIADVRAAIQDHTANQVEASGVANALYVTLLRDIALPNQHDVSFATQLRKAISTADLTPTGAVQVAFAL